MSSEPQVWIDETEDEPRLAIRFFAGRDASGLRREFTFILSLERLRQLGVEVIEPEEPAHG